MSRLTYVWILISDLKMDYAKLRDNFNVPAGKIDFISLGIPNVEDKVIYRKLAECLKGLGDRGKAPDRKSVV